MQARHVLCNGRKSTSYQLGDLPPWKCTSLSLSRIHQTESWKERDVMVAAATSIDVENRCFYFNPPWLPVAVKVTCVMMSRLLAWMATHLELVICLPLCKYSRSAVCSDRWPVALSLFLLRCSSQTPCLNSTVILSCAPAVVIDVCHLRKAFSSPCINCSIPLVSVRQQKLHHARRSPVWILTLSGVARRISGSYKQQVKPWVRLHDEGPGHKKAKGQGMSHQPLR